MNTRKLDHYVERLIKGDNSAFDYVYDKTNRSVYFAILYIVKQKAQAEDLLQDTYLRALNSLDSYKLGTNFIGWLITIGRSLALNHVKKISRETLTDFAEDSYKYGTTETYMPFIFQVASKILNEEEYEIIMLCHVAGYKRREVADMLNIPIGTVTWKNNEALKKLKKHLEKEGNV